MKIRTQFKSMLLIAISTFTTFSLTGCGTSGLDPNKFEVILNEEFHQGAPGMIMDKYYPILTIRSIDSTPISVNAVSVNDGRCSFTKTEYGQNIEFPQHFQIGQVLKLYLRCSVDSVVKVDVDTDQGAGSYSFK